MKSLVLVLLAVVVCEGAPSYPYPIHPGVGAIYKGPNSETIIEGPDGSVITSLQEGGEVAIKGEAPIVGPGSVLVGPSHGLVAPGPGSLGGVYGLVASGPGVLGAAHGLVPSGPGVLGAGPSLAAHIGGFGSLAPVISEPILTASVGPIISEPILTASVSPIISEPIITASAPPAIVPLAPAVLGSVTTPLLATNPIVVSDVAVVAKDPKIVEEHVVVGDKIITVPKKLEENVDLVGPSGTISTRGGDAVIAGPSSTTIKGGGVVASIDKPDDINIKSVEVKPVIAPAIIQVPKVIAPAPVITPAVETVITARPILAPIPDSRVGGGIIHPPALFKTGPSLVNPILSSPNFIDPSLTVVPDFYAPVLGGHHLKPIIKGPFH